MRLESLVRETPADKWRKRPTPERWSAGEVLAHLADAEIVTGWRVRSILASDGFPLQPFDQNVWAEALKYGEIDPARIARDLLRGASELLLSLLRRVDPSRRQHHGLHAERGKESIEHLLQL